jgi:hypothetical protein
VLSGEATNTNFIVFGLTRPTIYRTRGEHANQYATDAVSYTFTVFCLPQNSLKFSLILPFRLGFRFVLHSRKHNNWYTMYLINIYSRQFFKLKKKKNGIKYFIVCCNRSTTYNSWTHPVGIIKGFDHSVYANILKNRYKKVRKNVGIGWIG